LKFLRKRSTIVLASIGAAGAIAALATAASFALFYDPPAPVNQTFAAGTVTLGTPFSYTCNTGTNTLTTPPAGSTPGTIDANTAVAPGFSTDGYPEGNAGKTVGDQSGTTCTFGITYTGNMPAFLATDVTVTSTAGSESSATCDGTCLPLYSPTTSTDTSDLEVWTTYKVPSGNIYALGIGGDQTISEPGATDVDTTFGSTCVSGGDDCPVNKGYTVLYRIYVSFPLGSSSADNPYQGSSATVTLNVHGVQAYDNALKSCAADTIVDPEQNGVPWTYTAPDQPKVGWGGGFNSGTYPSPAGCPTADNTADDWTAGPADATLYPFSHETG
jgi:hypothetical protein